MISDVKWHTPVTHLKLPPNPQELFSGSLALESRVLFRSMMFFASKAKTRIHRFSAATIQTGHVLFGASCISISSILTDKPGNIQFTTPTLKPQNGNAVKLSCSSSAVPTPTYRIYKITGSSSTLISNSGSHTIPSINYVDYNGYKATFRCQSSNSFGNATKDIQLDIQGINFQIAFSKASHKNTGCRKHIFLKRYMYDIPILILFLPIELFLS